MRLHVDIAKIFANGTGNSNPYKFYYNRWNVPEYHVYSKTPRLEFKINTKKKFLLRFCSVN